MVWGPKFKLYAADGTTLIYQFFAVQYTNIPQSSKRTVVIEGFRGNGGIVLSGSNNIWEAIIRGTILDTNFTNITTKIDAMEATIVFDTPYVLKFDKSQTETYSYHVKRIKSIEYSESLRNNFQEYLIILSVNAW